MKLWLAVSAYHRAIDQTIRGCQATWESTTLTQASKWWSNSDDLSLLTQVNNDIPFKQVKNTTKAWDALAAKLLEVPGFGRSSLDGKKAANRFYQLLRTHRRFQNSSKYMSGVEQDETGKIVLLDELVQLFDEATDQRNADRAAVNAKAMENEASASFIRELAMTSGRIKSVDTDESTDSDVIGQKRNAVFESHEREIELERERFSFEKYKLQMELAEREKDRMERIQQREFEMKRNDDMIALLIQLASKLPND
ncbi:hypothetical protein H310_10351 [Aphanomyces invadans]|uniref:Myb-like domain-containing protein n=1 Tax=Aphanomyces invadans TaxID=157072 RepID=A0A024TR94_9STRA|nr:hypothetical protein H310_10351 [Aphanomyces invadans]ETV96675.1 hypothetical protein H310_10351 [Aphanomyces invadans]|eukprot:XP_008874938.1 hypothetical protein H310_10351 [Aphanomyces invadans]